MGVVANLVPSTVTVQPGGQAVVLLRLRNTGSIVDRFDVSVVGPSASWARVDPPSISLFPGAEGETRIVFAPARAAEPRAGTVPFGVRITPEADARGGAVEEGRVTVLPFTEVSATIVPQTSRGARAGKHEVVVENRGNAPVAVDMLPSDPDRLLAFEIPNAASSPEGGARFSIAPAERGFLALIARPVETFLGGQKRTLPFTIDVRAGEQPPLQLRASLVQGPVLPPWLVPVAGLAAAAALAIVFLPSILGAGQPKPGATAITITPTPLITPSPTPEPTPSPTPEPTEAPPVTPKPQTAHTATITFRNLGLEDPRNEGFGNPSLSIQSQGPGPITVSLDQLSGGPGVRICFKRNDCHDLKKTGDVATTRSNSDGNVDWTISVDVVSADSPPTVDLTLTYPSDNARLTYADNAAFDGNPSTSGIAVILTPTQAGAFLARAEFGGHLAFWKSAFLNITVGGSQEWGDQPPDAQARFDSQDRGMLPQTTYRFDWTGLSIVDVPRVDYTATLTWKP